MPDDIPDQGRPTSKVRWLKSKAADTPPSRPLKLGPALPPDDPEPPKVMTPEIPQFLVGQPAQPARARKRHWLLLLSFAVLVVLPSLLTAFYLWQRAADYLWFNPMVHIVGLMRDGYYPFYHPTYVSIVYPLGISALTCMCGLFLLNRYHRDVLDL